MFSGLDDSIEDSSLIDGALELDASSVTLSSYKPRSRQSSFIGRSDQSLIRPSSRAGNVSGVSSSFNIGAFRRRAREPSIRGTARKPYPETASGAVEADARAVESSSEDEVEFRPDDESTPLRNRRSTIPRRAPKEQDEELPQAVPDVGSSTKRKRANSSEHSARSTKVSRVDQNEHEDSVAAISSDSESELSELPSPQALVPRLSTPIRGNEDEPSSLPASPASGGGTWPDARSLSRLGRRLAVQTPPRGRADNASDISSPPSLAHSPDLAPTKTREKRGRQARRPHSPKLTGTELANIIPPRRSKRRDDFDLDDDEELDAAELGQHDDELSYLDAARRTKTRRPASSSGRKNKTTAAKGKQRATFSKRQLRGRSRRPSDKENQSHTEGQDEEDTSQFEPLPDETFDETMAAARGQAEELIKAREKFKEVDRWGLSFEETSRSSSPIGAR